MTIAVVTLGILCLALIALCGGLVWRLIQTNSDTTKSLTSGFTAGVRDLTQAHSDLTETLLLGRDSQPPNGPSLTNGTDEQSLTMPEPTLADFVNDPSILEAWKREMDEPPDQTHLMRPLHDLEEPS